MKQAFLLGLLVSFALASQAQNGFQQAESNSISSVPDPWDLNKYVWSHTHSPAKAGKSILDFHAIENWMIIGPEDELSISPDGKYVAYTIQNTMHRTRDTLVIQSITNSWRQAYKINWFSAIPGFFSRDCKQ